MFNMENAPNRVDGPSTCRDGGAPLTQLYVKVFARKKEQLVNIVRLLNKIILTKQK
jgi:hypothetical protein